MSTQYYNEKYFSAQLSKSDEKIGWFYHRVFQMAKVQPHGRVLDIGCGAGPGLRYLERHNVQAIGVDLIHYPLQQAQKMVASTDLVQADVEYTLPFADASIDIVLMSELIEHLRNGRPMIFECARVLRPGGYIIVTTPNLWDIRRTLAPLLGNTWSGDTDPTHVNLYTPIRLVDDLTSAGFTNIQWRTGIKPMLWLSSKKLRMRLSVPYPPMIGNGLLVTGLRE